MKKKFNPRKVLICILIVLFSNILLFYCYNNYNLNKKVYIESKYNMLIDSLDNLKNKIDIINEMEIGIYNSEELAEIKTYFSNYYKILSENKVLDIKKDGYYKNKYILKILLDDSLLRYSNEQMDNEYKVLKYAGNELYFYENRENKKNIGILLNYLKAAVNNGTSKLIDDEFVFDYNDYYYNYYTDLQKCHSIANKVLDKVK